MREDEAGNPCPETLGEYRKLCEALGLPNNKAVAFLDKMIEDHEAGEDEIVVAADSQMRLLLMPMLIEPVGEEPEPELKAAGKRFRNLMGNS